MMAVMKAVCVTLFGKVLVWVVLWEGCLNLQFITHYAIYANHDVQHEVQKDQHQLIITRKMRSFLLNSQNPITGLYNQTLTGGKSNVPAVQAPLGCTLVSQVTKVPASTLLADKLPPRLAAFPAPCTPISTLAPKFGTW
jgi:hypothetical protein